MSLLSVFLAFPKNDNEKLKNNKLKTIITINLNITIPMQSLHNSLLHWISYSLIFDTTRLRHLYRLMVQCLPHVSLTSSPPEHSSPYPPLYMFKPSKHVFLILLIALTSDLQSFQICTSVKRVIRGITTNRAQ